MKLIDKKKNSNLVSILEDYTKGTCFNGEEEALITHGKVFNYKTSLINSLIYRKHIKSKINSKSHIKFIDLFAGIGGFHIALGENGADCLFSCEWDHNAKISYYKNYGVVPFGDINKFTNLTLSDEELDLCIPDHNILCAGFPCQPFSRAGVSARNSLGIKHGFEDETQGTLFYSIARIVRVKKPEILFLENVRNIVSHNNGKTFETIEKVISKLGYKFNHDIINSSTLVPQRRIRCYMVCVRKDVEKKHGKFEFPKFEGLGLPLKNILENNPEEKYFISDKLWQGHIRRTENNLKRKTGFTAHLANIEKPSNTIVARYGKDGKECLIREADDRIRMLTASECRNLFGFPEGFKVPDAKTTCYKQFGNSVIVPVIHKIAKKIINIYFPVKKNK